MARTEPRICALAFILMKPTLKDLARQAEGFDQRFVRRASICWQPEPVTCVTPRVVDHELHL